MIVIFDKQTILNYLSPLTYTVSSRTAIPALEGFHLNCTSDNICKAETFDNEKGIKTQFECQVLEEGNCVIEAQKFLQIIKTLPDGEIKVSVDSNYKTVIESGLSHFDIKALPGGDFPSIPDVLGEKGFVIPQYLFKKLVNKISFAIAQNDSRPVFSGAYFQIDEDSVTIVSCDSNRLAFCEKRVALESRNRDGSSLNLKFIVPGKTLSDAIKMIKDSEDTMEIKVTRRYMVFKIGEFTLFSKTIDSDYINYERLLPKEHKIVTYLKAEDLRNALERSSLIVEDRLNGSIRSFVKFTIDEVLSISTNSANGNVYDELDIRKENDGSITIAFNCKFLLEAIRVCDDGEIKMSYSNPFSGVLIEPQNKEEGTYKYFVMPIRMNS
ncbi:MAG: DNA polymerase III subunit beta [Clostridia bacterium]|nr:DNA polymerase III subunit beta [Clostridia bacterium]